VRPTSAEPTAQAIAEARWYGGKGRPIAAVRELDRLELPGGAALRVLEVTEEGGARERYLWPEGAVGEPLVRRLAAAGGDGAFAFTPAPALDGLLPASGERPIGHDQSNTSVVVGERLVVKLYRRLEAGAHPEIELGAHLTARGLRCVPAFAGAVGWAGHPLALVQAYVPDAEQGWRWGGRAVAAGDVGRLGELGRVTAELHAALAELGSRPATPGELAGWRAAAERQLERAIAVTTGEARALLESRRAHIAGELAALASPAAPPVLTRVHGDLHIGQVLLADDRLVVVDLEGEPGRPLAERARPGSPLRDVAGMLRSFDHLARYVQHERAGGRDVAPERWIAAAREAFLAGYGPVDGALLRALEVEKECYEFTYAAAYLPEWTYVAVGGMRWLLGERNE
jgi:maltokinase